MSPASSGWLILLLALVAANLPFLVDRAMFFRKVAHKHFGWHFLEMVLLYFCIGGIARIAETRLAPPHAQRWEFYAVTFSLFLVLAFPGYVYRYLWKKPSSARQTV